MENRIKEVKELIQKNEELNNNTINDLESEITNLEKQISKREDLKLDIEDLQDDINCLRYDLKEAELLVQRLDR